MEIVTPAFGLVFWTVIIFSVLLIVLRVFAWRPILHAVKRRNDSIANAMNAAEKAKEKLVKLQANNEQILKEAQVERDTILLEARDIKEKIITEAKEQAKIEADKIIELAKKEIENEKRTAVNEIKNQIALLSIDIATKILQKELTHENQQQYIETLINSTNIN